MCPTLKAGPPAKAGAVAVPLCLLPPPPAPPLVIDLVGTSQHYDGPIGVPTCTAAKSPPPPLVAAAILIGPKKPPPRHPNLGPWWSCLGGGVPGTLDDGWNNDGAPIAPVDPAPENPAPAGPLDPAADTSSDPAPACPLDPALTQPLTPPDFDPAEPAADPAAAADAAYDAADPADAAIAALLAPTRNTGLPAWAWTGRCVFLTNCFCVRINS